MFKNALVVCLLSLAGVINAHAYTESYDKGFSTATVVGMDCSSGTATNVTQTLSGFKIGGYRVSNLNATNAIYIGYNGLVSTDSASGYVGVPIYGTGNGTFILGTNPDISDARLSLWCRAANGATSGARIALEVFGYK